MEFETNFEGKEILEKAVRAAGEILEGSYARLAENMGGIPLFAGDKKKIAAALESYDASEE